MVNVDLSMDRNVKTVEDQKLARQCLRTVVDSTPGQEDAEEDLAVVSDTRIIFTITLVQEGVV